MLGSKGQKGRAVVIVIGGAREVICQDQDRIELILLNRKGFVKKALKFGVDLVPTFSFGEAFIYSNMCSNPRGSFIRNLQEKILDKSGWPVPFFFGRGIFQYSFHPLSLVLRGINKAARSLDH